MASRLREHRTYISDINRLKAYREAIAEVVKPGDTVVDLGCGTGVLGLLALQAGAGRVIAIDQTPMWTVARRLALLNGFSEQVTYLPGASNRVQLPRRVPVVVCDQMGPLGYEAGLLEASLDAANRFLTDAGHLVPSRLEMWMAPAQSPHVRDAFAVWTSSQHGLDFSTVLDDDINSIQVLPRHAAGDCLAPGQCVYGLTLGAPSSTVARQTGTAEWIVERAGPLDGLRAWFVAQLSPSVRVTNDPDSAAALDRAHAFLPTAGHLHLEPGDVVSVDCVFSPIPRHLEWHVTVRPRHGASVHLSHSSLRGNALSAAPLEGESN